MKGYGSKSGGKQGGGTNGGKLPKEPGTPVKEDKLAQATKRK